MHCQVKNISRSSGQSAVASSAYRSGERLQDKETGIVHDYTKKSEVEFSEIILCKNAPEEYKDRATLWNEVQKIEKASDSRLAREWEVAIPKELSKEQAKELVHNFGQSLADEGMCVDLSIHWKNGNHHAHIMGTTRPIKENGEWGTKEKKAYSLDQNGMKIPILDENGEQKIGAKGRKMWQRETVESNDWNKREKVEEWRERWANECNKHLNQDNQIDHRSYERQGIEQIPTIHEGYAAREIERKGGVSEICQTNRKIVEQNRAFEKVREILLKTKMKLNEFKEKINEELKRRNKGYSADRPNDRTNRGTTRGYVGTSAEHTTDRGSVRPFGERERGEREIAYPDNRARERVGEINKLDSGMEILSRKIAETERGIVSIKSKLEKVREINDKFAKFRRNVGASRDSGQEDYNSAITDRTIELSKITTGETDRRIAELKRNEAIKQIKDRQPTFDNPGRKTKDREPEPEHRYSGPSL